MHIKFYVMWIKDMSHLVMFLLIFTKYFLLNIIHWLYKIPCYDYVNITFDENFYDHYNFMGNLTNGNYGNCYDVIFLKQLQLIILRI